eukprot:SAG22_NODE_714_length_7722_cov_3.919585_1_plen_31_part_00
MHAWPKPEGMGTRVPSYYSKRGKRLIMVVI